MLCKNKHPIHWFQNLKVGFYLIMSETLNYNVYNGVENQI